QGKFFEIAIDAGASRDQVHKDIDAIARDVLTNPVIEEYRVEFLEYESTPLLSFLRVYHGNGRHIHDIVHFSAILQHVDRLAHAHKDWAEGFGAADARQQFVGHVARFQVRKNQNVGPAL